MSKDFTKKELSDLKRIEDLQEIMDYISKVQYKVIKPLTYEYWLKIDKRKTLYEDGTYWFPYKEIALPLKNPLLVDRDYKTWNLTMRTPKGSRKSYREWNYTEIPEKELKREFKYWKNDVFNEWFQRYKFRREQFKTVWKRVPEEKKKKYFAGK